MKYLMAYIYSKISLLKMFILYDSKDIQFMYDIGLIGTEEGQLLRKIFRK